MNDAILVGIGALLTAVPGAVGAGLAVWAKYQKDRRDATLAEWQEVWKRQREHADDEIHRLEVRINELVAQVRRLETVNAELQHVLSEMHTEHARCQAEIGEAYLWIHRYYDAVVHRDKLLAKTGNELDAVPPPPARKTSSERVDFLARSASQDVILSQHIGRVQSGQPPPPPPPTGPNQ